MSVLTTPAADVDFSVRLTAPLFVAPVDGGRPVRLCKGAEVRVVRVSGSRLVCGFEFAGRRFSAPVIDLRSVSVLCGVRTPVPAAAPVVSSADAASAARAAGAAAPGFWEPRVRGAGDAADAPLRGRPAPARRRRPSAGRPSDAVRASLNAHVRRNRGDS